MDKRLKYYYVLTKMQEDAGRNTPRHDTQGKKSIKSDYMAK